VKAFLFREIAFATGAVTVESCKPPQQALFIYNTVQEGKALPLSGHRR
jgi:hypothetical protein